MRHLKIVLLLLLVSGWPSPPIAGVAADDGGEALVREAAADLVGKVAPALRMQTIDGETVDLATLVGRRPIYIKFWATWCVPCREQMPHFERVQQQHGRDGTLAAAFHLKVTPQHIVIGRDGRIAYVGHLANANVDAAIARAIAQQALFSNVTTTQVLVATTRAGDDLPDLKIRDVAGATIALADPKHQRITAITFFATWCESYLAESRPAYSANCRRARIRAGKLSGKGQVRVIGIATGLWTTPKDVERYRHDHAVPYRVALDYNGSLFRSLGIHDVPTTLVISSRGQIVGSIDADDVTPQALEH